MKIKFVSLPLITALQIFLNLKFTEMSNASNFYEGSIVHQILIMSYLSIILSTIQLVIFFIKPSASYVIFIISVIFILPILIHTEIPSLLGYILDIAGIDHGNYHAENRGLALICAAFMIFVNILYSYIGCGKLGSTPMRIYHALN